MTTTSDPLILYHADCDDGFGAAYAAWLSLGDGAEYRPVYYGDAIPPELLVDRKVFILDFSFSPDVIRSMPQKSFCLITTNPLLPSGLT
jgi:hypothetical protein